MAYSIGEPQLTYNDHPQSDMSPKSHLSPIPFLRGMSRTAHVIHARHTDISAQQTRCRVVPRCIRRAMLTAEISSREKARTAQRMTCRDTDDRRNVVYSDDDHGKPHAAGADPCSVAECVRSPRRDRTDPGGSDGTESRPPRVSELQQCGRTRVQCGGRALGSLCIGRSRVAITQATLR